MDKPILSVSKTVDHTEGFFIRLFGSRVLRGDFAVKEVILDQKEDIACSVARGSINGRKSRMIVAPSTWLCKSTRNSMYSLPEHAAFRERRMPTSAVTHIPHCIIYRRS